MAFEMKVEFVSEMFWYLRFVLNILRGKKVREIIIKVGWWVYGSLLDSFIYIFIYLKVYSIKIGFLYFF